MRIKADNRYELKYVLDQAQCQPLLNTLATYLECDTNGDGEGRYSVTSLYYDSPDYRAYWDKLEGHRFRRKVRVRVYGNQQVTPQTACFLEIKQRLNKTLRKKRVMLPYAAATALCEAGEAAEQALSSQETAMVDEVHYLQQILHLQPACVVSYDRLAFEGSEQDPGLRITFDTYLKGRIYDLSLLSQGAVESYFILPPQWCVMEIKVNYRVPYWLTELVGRYRCTLRRISKYCTALEQGKVVRRRGQIIY